MTGDSIDINVGLDNQAAIFAATEHLIASGRRVVGMICGSLASNQRDRDVGKVFWMPFTPMGLMTGCLWNCSGDTFAAGALFGAQRHGWAVPGRIALIGLGDLELNRQTVPSLSTAEVPGYRIGVSLRWGPPTRVEVAGRSLRRSYERP